MRQIVVGISDCQLSGESGSSLITYALGSCIGVAVHDSQAGVGGLLHFMLPDSTMNVKRAEDTPCMFADTGIPTLFRKACSMGAEKRRLTVSLLGGAQILDTKGEFNIGKKNYLAAKKLLWKAGVMIHAEHVGGTLPRTVRLEVGSGRIYFRAPGQPEKELAVAAAGGKHGFPSPDRG